MKRSSGDTLCPWRAAAALLAAAAVIPCLGSGDPLGREVPRIVALQAAALLACLLAASARPRLAWPALGIWLAPALLAAIFLLGLRDVPTLTAGLPLFFAAALSVPAAAAGTRRPTALALLAAAMAAAVAVAAWGVVDGILGGAGVGPLGNANRVGEYVITALPAALACYLLARRRSLIAAGLLATVLLFGLTLICKSRGGLITGAVEVVVLAAVAASLRGPGLLSTSPWRRTGALALAALVLAGAAWCLPMTRPHVEQAVTRLAAGVSSDYPANRVRLGLVRGSAALATDHPLGVGHGRFREAFIPHRDPVEHRTSGWKSIVTHAHNQYLHTAAEGGWPGALLFVAFAWVIGLLLLRRVGHTAEPVGRALRLAGGTAFIGVGVVSLFATPLLNPAALTNLALLGGAAAGARAGTEAFRRGRGLSFGLAVALAAAALLTVPAVNSYRARVAVFDAHTPAALEATWRHVLRVDPSDADAWRRLGHLQARAGRRAEALTSFERALEARPRFPACLLGAGDLLAADQRYADALGPVKKAAELQPWNPHPHHLTGKILLAAGDREGGRAALERAMAEDRAAAPTPDATPSPVARAALDTLTTHLMGRADLIARTTGRTAAAEVYRQILALDPGHPDANLQLGLALRRAGQVEEARKLRYRGHLERAVRLLRTLIGLESERGKPVPAASYEKVLANLVRAHDNDPKNAAPFYYMVVTRRQRGRDEAPWNDTEQVAAAVAEARRRGLDRLADAPDGGEFRALVAPVWR